MEEKQERSAENNIFFPDLNSYLKYENLHKKGCWNFPKIRNINFKFKCLLNIQMTVQLFFISTTE